MPTYHVWLNSIGGHDEQSVIVSTGEHAAIQSIDQQSWRVYAVGRNKTSPDWLEQSIVAFTSVPASDGQDWLQR